MLTIKKYDVFDDVCKQITNIMSIFAYVFMKKGGYPIYIRTRNLAMSIQVSQVNINYMINVKNV